MTKIRTAMNEVELAVETKAKELVKGTKAEAYVDSAIKILIAVVIGALLLSGLYLLFTKVIFPKVNDTTTGMFTASGIENLPGYGEMNNVIGGNTGAGGNTPG